MAFADINSGKYELDELYALQLVSQHELHWSDLGKVKHRDREETGSRQVEIQLGKT